VKLAGIDYSTHCIDVVLLDDSPAAAGELPWWIQYNLPSVGNAFERTREVAEVLPARRSVFWDDVYAVAIEEAFGYGGSAAKLMRVQGAILSCIPRDVTVVPLAPARWRASAGLRAQASKQEVREWVMLALGTDPPWTQDACDAYCLVRALAEKLEEVEV